MSEDLIERQNVEAILRRRVGGCYGDCATLCLSCAATKDLAAVRAIPAFCSPAERLARAADVLDRAETEFARAPADGVRAANDAFDRAREEFRSALAAYRASAHPEPVVRLCGSCYPDKPGWVSGIGGWERCRDCRGDA